ncbi:MAG: VOC family protein [Planctomycetota bacterium]|nr:VOC family protein [Planctomycetota bacterium]
MSDAKIGTIAWRDLTVADAEGVRDFYAQVVGWDVKPHPMGEYDDYEMVAPGTGETVAGVCHARGPNATVPPQWLVYVVVENVAESAQRCTALGGKVVEGPRKMGAQDFCVVQDPAGAMLALIQG